MRTLLRNLADIVVIGGGLSGLALSLLYVNELLGGRGVLFGLLLFPYTFLYFPFYSLFIEGDWNLFLINYGSMAAGWALFSVANSRKKQPRSAVAEPPTRPVVTRESPKVSAFLWIAVGFVLVVILSALANS
jgi:hypothetical protein